VQENDVDVRAPHGMPGFHRFLRRVDQAEVADLDTGPAEFSRDLPELSFEFGFESFELRPTGLGSDAKKSDAKRMRILPDRVTGEVTDRTTGGVCCPCAFRLQK
jgi:hypothetical protein